MTTPAQTLQDDINFLRALAEEGRSPALQGGAFLVAAGTIFGVANLACYALNVGLFGPPTAIEINSVWGLSMVSFIVALNVLKRRIPSGKGAKSRATELAWTGAGWTIFVLVGCLALIAWRQHSMIPLMVLPPLILGLYGMAWTVAAGLTHRRWIWMAAIGSYLCALASALIADQAEVYLLFGGALFMLAVVPGLFMIRESGART